jgi:hypothetical protein
VRIVYPIKTSIRYKIIGEEREEGRGKSDLF